MDIAFIFNKRLIVYEVIKLCLRTPDPSLLLITCRWRDVCGSLVSVVLTADRVGDRMFAVAPIV